MHIGPIQIWQNIGKMNYVSTSYIRYFNRADVSKLLPTISFVPNISFYLHQKCAKLYESSLKQEIKLHIARKNNNFGSTVVC